MMGSDAAFGGRKNYFTSHGDYEIDDYYWAISEGLIPEGYYQCGAMKMPNCLSMQKIN